MKIIILIILILLIIVVLIITGSISNIEDLLPDEYPENIGDPYRTEQRNDFHIGQSYDDETCQTIICNKCNSDKFTVGEGSYFTAIKCINCGWEICIHDG